jgi:hypothetical protein
MCDQIGGEARVVVERTGFFNYMIDFRHLNCLYVRCSGFLHKQKSSESGPVGGSRVYVSICLLGLYTGEGPLIVMTFSCRKQQNKATVNALY